MKKNRQIIKNAGHWICKNTWVHFATLILFKMIINFLNVSFLKSEKILSPVSECIMNTLPSKIYPCSNSKNPRKCYFT